MTTKTNYMDIAYVRTFVVILTAKDCSIQSKKFRSCHAGQPTVFVVHCCKDVQDHHMEREMISTP